MSLQEGNKMKKLFNVQINHPMYSIHYVAKDIPLEKAKKVAEKYAKIFCPRTVFIENIYQNGKTTVHESMSYYDIINDI